MSALSELLAEHNTAGMSARSIARRAQAAGFSLNHDTAARYLRGDHGQPDETTLLAFAKVLRVSLKSLRSAAALPADEAGPYLPPAEASRLNRRQRRAVDEIIRAMLDPAARQRPDELAERRSATGQAARGSGGATRGGTATAGRPAGRSSQAARRGPVEPGQG